MDPVSIIGLAASVNQLAATAKSTFSVLFQYYGDFRDAPKRSRELRQELGTICDLLDSLDDGLTSQSTNSSFTIPASLNLAIEEFQTMLENIKPRVKESQTKGVRRLKWPFTKDENDRYLSRMERYKATINVALNIKSA